MQPKVNYNSALCIHISDAEVYYDVIPEKPHGQPNSETAFPMAVVKTSDESIEMSQNQVYGTVATHRDPVAVVDKIEMTQNQVYGTQNTVAESAARNQPSYQNIIVPDTTVV